MVTCLVDCFSQIMFCYSLPHHLTIYLILSDVDQNGPSEQLPNVGCHCPIAMLVGYFGPDLATSGSCWPIVCIRKTTLLVARVVPASAASASRSFIGTIRRCLFGCLANDTSAVLTLGAVVV